MREYYSVLSISEAMMEETGDYTCLVTNVHGTVNNTAHVEVQSEFIEHYNLLYNLLYNVL